MRLHRRMGVVSPLPHDLSHTFNRDLLFYLSHLTLFFVAFVYFVKFKEMEVRFTKLVRQLALENARRETEH